MTAPDDSGGPLVEEALRASRSNHVWGRETDPAAELSEVDRLREEAQGLRDTNSRLDADLRAVETRYREAGERDRRVLQDALAAQATAYSALVVRVGILMELKGDYQRYVAWLEQQIEDRNE